MHVDADVVALLALGEEAGTEDERRHVASCSWCASELAELQRVVALGRSVGDVELVTPSPDLWLRIHDELALEAGVRAPGRSDDETLADPRTGDGLTAYARLAPVSEDWSLASGRADLGTDERGRLLMQLVLHADLPPAGVRQAWLVHRDDPARRHSLGMLDGPDGVWTVDRSIDLRTYAVVAVVEAGTAEDAPEGTTIVRGELVLAG